MSMVHGDFCAYEAQQHCCSTSPTGSSSAWRRGTGSLTAHHHRQKSLQDDASDGVDEMMAAMQYHAGCPLQRYAGH